MRDAFKVLAQESVKASVWNVRPFQIVSLLEMIEIHLPYFIDIYMRLGLMAKETKRRKPLTQDEQDSLVLWMKRIEAECGKYEIDVSHYTDRVIGKIQIPDLKPRLDTLIAAVRTRIEEDLTKRRFLYIPMKESAKYERDDLFGLEVKARFPRAVRDIKAAGNCYATGNYTACVFHCMRVVELGARAMVRSLKVQNLLMRGSVRVPVGLCEWGALIPALQTGVDALSAGARTDKRKKKKHEFFNHALGTFRNFKDAWRNHVSHTREREPYTEFTALIVMTNTEHFMAHLATRLNKPRGNAPVAVTDESFVRW